MELIFAIFGEKNAPGTIANDFFDARIVLFIFFRFQNPLESEKVGKTMGGSFKIKVSSVSKKYKYSMILGIDFEVILRA